MVRVQDMDSDRSSVDHEIIDPEEKNVHVFAKQMLLNRLFIGNYKEKRYVDALQTYRDVVIVASSERDLIYDIEVVKKRLQDFYGQEHWIGLTLPGEADSSGCTCWVEINDEPFGPYWYKIRAVRFRHNEVLLRLRTVRSVSESDVLPSDGTVSQITTEDVEKLITNLSFEVISSKCKNLVVDLLAFTLSTFSSIVTMDNVKATLTFLTVIVMTILTGAGPFFKHVGDFTLRLMRETSNLIKVLTPIVLGLFNLVSKIVGGFYLLIAMMWRDSRQPQGPPDRQYLSYRTVPNGRNMLTYPRYN